MSINSIETAVKYSNELDKLFASKSVTGFFADNTFAKKFVGAKTVIVPDIDFQGLSDYDRHNGFSKGAITVSNTAYTMKMDRARSLQIDREDMDETGIAALAGKVLGEYVRTKVVPECDAYVLSKLSQIAINAAQTTEMNPAKPYETLTTLIDEVRNVVGYDEELVAFVNSNVYSALENSAEISRMLVTSDFKKGDINLNVKSVNGVAIMPVLSGLMHTEYAFNNDEAGGFDASEERQTLMLVCPKKAVHLVKKTETMRIFTPEQNIDADAYKFDYRIYYDAFVKKSEIGSIWAAVSPEVKASVDIKLIEVAKGENYFVSTNPETFNPDAHTYTYQWYYSLNEDRSNPVRIANATESSLAGALANINEAGTYYLFAKVRIDGLTYITTDTCKLVIS